jgi:hypothetical protein
LAGRFLGGSWLAPVAVIDGLEGIPRSFDHAGVTLVRDLIFTL